jgi:RNA polymerase sigma factor (sigma-70 family)
MAGSRSQPVDKTSAFAACERAFREEFDHVCRALRRQGVASADAEDLAQEVFLVMWRRWSDYDVDRPLRPWLGGIAYRLAHHYRRRRWREVPGSAADEENVEDGGLAGEERLTAWRAQALVLEALTHLPDRHRTVIVLHDLGGLTVQELATKLSTPLSTVYSRIRRARLALLDELRRLDATGKTIALPAEAVAELERDRAPGRPRRNGVVLAALAERRPPPAPIDGAILWAIDVAMVLVGVLTIGLSRPVPPPAARVRHAVAVAARPALPPPLLARVRAAPRRAPPPPSARRDLIGHWRFDESPGSTVARDVSGQGHDCVLRDLDPTHAWVEGRLGGAIDLGEQGWLECPQPELVAGAPPPELSVSVWVKRQRLRLGHNVALVTREMGATDEDYFFFGFDGYLLKATGRAWKGQTTSGLPANLERWVHLAFTHAADGTNRLFADGVEVARAQVAQRTLMDSNAPLMIGAGYSRADRLVRQHFAGAVDELRIYQRALGDDEVAALALTGERNAGQARD